MLQKLFLWFWRRSSLYKGKVVKTVAAKAGMMIREHDCEMLLLEPVEMKLSNERSVVRMHKIPVLEFDRAPTNPRQRRSVLKFKKSWFNNNDRVKTRSCNALGLVITKAVPSSFQEITSAAAGSCTMFHTLTRKSGKSLRRGMCACLLF